MILNYQVVNVMYIDLPVGTGFSYSQTQEGYHTSDTMWIDNTYEFLQKVNNKMDLAINRANIFLYLFSNKKVNEDIIIF